MLTSSSNLDGHKNLANKILKAFDDISIEYSSFQNKTKLTCPTGCGKCCFKSDIYCTPFELLPLALDLIRRGEAESILEKGLSHKAEHCMFMDITDLKGGKGRCLEYEFRPLVCRTFGVAGKHDKKGDLSFSVCSILKEENKKKYSELLSGKIEIVNIPFIDKVKNKLGCLDPSLLEEEYPINLSLTKILDKLLFEYHLRDLSNNFQSNI